MYKDFSELLDYLGFPEKEPMDVYADIFSLGFNEIQIKNEAPGLFKSNPLGYMKNINDKHGHYRILFDDDFEETLKQLQEADFSILNGLTYFGRKNTLAHANTMRAMIFDLDGVDPINLHNFLSGCRGGVYPIPQYIALSGHNVHLYYVFEYAVPLYPELKKQLKELKYALTMKIWNPYTSKLEYPQVQGINQGFRVLGGKTKIPGKRVRVYQIDSHPCNLEQLGSYVAEEYRINEDQLFKMNKYTLDEAREAFPEWYERRVVRGEPKRTWTCKRDLYDWWKRKIIDGASVHHRYFCIMVLAIYGVKCGIEFEEVKKDAYDLIPYLDSLSITDPFTQSDCDSALECYDPDYVTYPIKDISRATAIEIQKNKRNGRKQSDHVRMMNMIRDDINHNTTWNKVGNGRKPKKEVVAKWQLEHPNGRKADCIRDTGLTKPTVYKWWNSKETEKKEGV